MLFLLFPVLVGAQPPVPKSPIFNEDGSVTFFVHMPESRHVRIYCDCGLRNRKYNVNREYLQSARMSSDKDDLFTYTTPPLTPEVYTYRFKSRGQKLVDPHNADSIRVSNGKRSVFVVPGSPLSDLCMTDTLSGKMEQLGFWDRASGKTRRILLYLPPGYDSAGQAYPVLYLLHGIDGNERAWHDRGRAIQQVDNLIRQGKAEPMIVVMPDANPKKLVGQDEHVRLMRNLLLYSTWFHQDFEQMFPEIDSLLSTLYRIPSDKSMRAVAGLSAGAAQSATLANLYKDNFKYVGLFSPVLHRKQLPVSSNTVYWIGTGKTDIFHSQSRRFVRKLDQRQIPYLYYETGGGHVWRNWRLYLSEFLQFIFKDVEKNSEICGDYDQQAKELRP
jgi:enterochelin esterase family protein